MNLSRLRYFETEKLIKDDTELLCDLSCKVRRDALEMITCSGSGHLGGTMSSTDIYIMLWLCANIYPGIENNPERDRIVVSHGHTAAAVYAVLGNIGFFNIEDAIKNFRKDGSPFEGHPSIKVPGVEWCSGSLGQGLSVGCGFAIAAKMTGRNYHVFVAMGDGEQAKGQLQEAREFAIKFGLGNLTAIVDFNNLQASGKIENIMPQNIQEKYEPSGWRVMNIDGHDYQQIFQALRTCYLKKDAPTLIIANTVMGKGISFIENNYEYHGKILDCKQYKCALRGLNFDNITLDVSLNTDFINMLDISRLITEVRKLKLEEIPEEEPVEYRVNPGNPLIYEVGSMVDCRTAFGEALYDIASYNSESNSAHIVALDCDLVESVKLKKFAQKFPRNFIECGIQEHNAVTLAGALSKSEILTFFVDFGVFGLDEVYGQLRMNDINNTSVKLICTHNGLDVGEDGKTHQCIDYISLPSNLFNSKLIIPADANQTDRIIRYAATMPGNIIVAMGRSKFPVLQKEDGSVFFDKEYIFEYGKADWIRRGKDGTIITCGTMVCKALNACEKLKKKGASVGILNISCPLKLDTQKIHEAAKTGIIITYEDHNIRTGIGSIVGEFIAEEGLKCSFKRMGIRKYGVSASPNFQFREQSLDEDSLVDLLYKQINNNF